MPKATGEEVAAPERPGLAQSRVQGVLSTRALLSREGRETGPQLWHYPHAQASSLRGSVVSTAHV